MALGIFIIAITILALICFNPYVDIQEDSIILWYNWFGKRKFYQLWSRNY